MYNNGLWVNNIARSSICSGIMAKVWENGIMFGQMVFTGQISH